MAIRTASDPFTTRPPLRTRPHGTSFGGAPASPRSPRTPMLGRSISSQFGSPGSSFRVEQEELVVYELGARHLSAGFAGESRPRCVVRWQPGLGRRMGDYRVCHTGYPPRQDNMEDYEDWSGKHEFYRIDTRSLDLGLVEDKLERTVCNIHTDCLQLDQKPRRAVLVVPSLLPTPLLEIMLKVLFNHFTQPPTITMLTTSLLACVGAGQRNALVVDIGWEETVVTAVGEYKEVYQRRSVRAGKLLTQEMARLLKEEANTLETLKTSSGDFETAEDLVERIVWCRAATPPEDEAALTEAVAIPIPGSSGLSIPFEKFCSPTETALFTPTSPDQDDHDLPLPTLAHRALLALSLDLRALAISRIVITGGISHIPGLKHRLLQEIAQLATTRGWDPVHSYGSAAPHRQRVLQERSANVKKPAPEHEIPLSPTKKPIQDSIPHSERIHDDVKDPYSMKAESRATQRKSAVITVVRGVDTVGPWAGASLVASLRVKGVHEVEREEFLKHGLRDGEDVM